HFTSKLWSHRLQLDALVGLHYEDRSWTPDASRGGDRAQHIDTRTVSLTTFEDVAGCRPQSIHGVSFLPCPVSSYDDGGMGYVSLPTAWRLHAHVSGTLFARLVGLHAVKLGADFEDVEYRNKRYYTGGVDGGLYTTLPLDPGDPTAIGVVRQQFAT